MVVLDANVILRYLLNDNEAMAREAESIIKTEVTMVPIGVRSCICIKGRIFC